MASTPWRTHSRPRAPRPGWRGRPAAASRLLRVLEPTLLGPYVGGAGAMAADARAQAGAPVLAAAGPDAVVTDPVPQAPAQVRARDPAARRPLAPVTLDVEAVARERPLAQVVLGRAADVRAARAAPGRAADAGGGLGGSGAGREGREPRGADDHPAQDIAAIHGPRDPLGELADPVIGAAARSSAHHGPSFPAGSTVSAGVARAASSATERAGRMQASRKARISAARTTDPAARTTPSPSTAISSGVADTW